MRTIAYVRNERRELADDNWDDYVSTIEFADDVPTAVAARTRGVLPRRDRLLRRARRERSARSVAPPSSG